jgi:hypothetical protein
MKTITATNKGIAINYEDTHKSSFIPYANDYSLTASTPNQKRNYLELNTIQKSMYRRLMYGQDAFTPEEITSMSPSTLFSIKKEHIRATEVLNQFKYERHYGAYNKLFAVIFPHIDLSYFKDGRYSEMPTLKELKISTNDIINLWIANKLLPSNFLSLNVETIKL